MFGFQFISSPGTNRQLLVGADDNVLDYFYLGYHTPMIDAHIEDMFWNVNGSKFIIQAIKDFQVNCAILMRFIINVHGEKIFKIREL